MPGGWFVQVSVFHWVPSARGRRRVDRSSAGLIARIATRRSDAAVLVVMSGPAMSRAWRELGVLERALLSSAPCGSSLFARSSPRLASWVSRSSALRAARRAPVRTTRRPRPPAAPPAARASATTRAAAPARPFRTVFRLLARPIARCSAVTSSRPSARATRTAACTETVTAAGTQAGPTPLQMQRLSATA